MKYYFTFIFLLALSTSTAQSFDEIIAKNKYVDCEDVSFNASVIINGFYENRQTSKIYDFLDYWQSKCGDTEMISRFRTIMDISGSRFMPNSISESTIENLLDYRYSLNVKNEFLSSDNDLDEIFISPQDLNSLNTLDSLTRKMARYSNAISDDERLLMDFYAAENPSFGQIKNASNNSKLKAFHNSLYDRAYNMWEWHYAFAPGIINYYGDISIFGARPVLAILVGAKKRRHNFDAVIDFRLGPSRNEYSFVYEGELITQDDWSAIYMGAEYTYDFLQTNKLNIGISPGIGYESITAIQGDYDTDEDGKFLESLNTNLGLVLKYKYGKRGGYIGMQFRYNWVDYSNRGGTPLNGEYLNVRLTFGRLFNFERSERLELLD